MRPALPVVLLLLTSVGAAYAESACPRLRSFIPGPETPADYVERPAGDSSITVFIPQQFWDLRACANKSDTVDPRAQKAK